MIAGSQPEYEKAFYDNQGGALNIKQTTGSDGAP
jgi:hypothetical protein